MPLHTPSEVAAALKVPINTIYYWASRREIPFLRVGRHLRFNLSEVLKTFAERTATGQHPCPLATPPLKPTRSRSLKTQDAGRPEPPDKEG